MKYINCKYIQADCQMAKSKVLESAPKNEYQLIKIMEKYFTGIHLRQLKNEKFKAYGEIVEPFENDSRKNHIGHTTFIVPSCTISYTRGLNGVILELNQFKN
jgi:hypothetical protein